MLPHFTNASFTKLTTRGAKIGRGGPSVRVDPDNTATCNAASVEVDRLLQHSHAVTSEACRDLLLGPPFSTKPSTLRRYILQSDRRDLADRQSTCSYTK
eukprot:scaffold391717_cov49-Attheya_sp.AAC.2